LQGLWCSGVYTEPAQVLFVIEIECASPNALPISPI
jgi:hypothetical protein